MNKDAKTEEQPGNEVRSLLETLPAIAAITATTDIRAFLKPGVPDTLKHAALRQAWATDLAIRDFVGIAENQWDFNKPQDFPGFGLLDASDNNQRLVPTISIGPSTKSENAPERQLEVAKRPRIWFGSARRASKVIQRVKRRPKQRPSPKVASRVMRRWVAPVAGSIVNDPSSLTKRTKLSGERIRPSLGVASPTAGCSAAC